MKYLEDMSNEELLMIAKRERVLLSLKFLRDELINNLETKGYAKKDPVKLAKEIEELEKEKSRPKKNEIRIAPDGSVEVIEIPLEEFEIEEVPEIKEEKVQKEYLSDSQENYEVAEEIAREINNEAEKSAETNEISKTEEEPEAVPIEQPDNHKKPEEEEQPEISGNEPIIEETEPEVKLRETEDEKSLDNKNNIRIVFLNQETKKDNTKKIRKKYHRNFIFRKSSKKLRDKTKCLYDLKSKLEFYPTSLDEDLVNRRIKERKIQNSKYLIGNERVSEKIKTKDIFFDKDPLPNAYFVDEIVLMPKNNNTLFTYWEIREDTYNKLKHDKNILDNVIIKVYKNGVEDKKIIRRERIGSHYIHDIEAANNYDVSIGYEDPNGEYTEIAHSSKSASPRDKISEEKDLKWLEVDENNVKKEINQEANIETEEEYIDEEVYSILLDKLRNVRSS